MVFMCEPEVNLNTLLIIANKFRDCPTANMKDCPTLLVNGIT